MENSNKKVWEPNSIIYSLGDEPECAFLIVSGILIHQKNQVINLYRKFKIYPVKISEEKKWITITFKKKNEKAH